MPLTVGGDAPAYALEPAAYALGNIALSTPDATTAALAAIALQKAAYITALGQVAATALADAVVVSIAAGNRPVASRPANSDPTKNPASRALFPLQTAGSMPLSAILDGLDGGAIQALSTATLARAT